MFPSNCNSYVFKAYSGYCSFLEFFPPPLRALSISLNAAEHMSLEHSAGSRILYSVRTHFIEPSKTLFISSPFSDLASIIPNKLFPRFTISCIIHGDTRREQGPLIWIWWCQLYETLLDNKCFRTELALYLEAVTSDSMQRPTDGLFKALQYAHWCQNP